MAPFDPYLAVRRFGTGLPAGEALPLSARDLLADLVAPDTLADQFEVPPSADYVALGEEGGRLRRAKRELTDQAEIDRLDAAAKEIKNRAGRLRMQAVRARVARGVAAPIGFRERLELFWADHFTVRTASGVYGGAIDSFREEAIRPYLSGRFADMLRAVAVEPVMLRYLDQHRSVGPNSRLGQRRGLGLNENYAREMIELHTLGVEGAYTQRDVVELARLLAGLTVRHSVFEWQAGRAEPGEKRVLGQVYGSETPQIEDVFAALDDLAVHPDTARHLARKLAVHFVSDRPDPGLVTHMAARYRAADGDLIALYAAMLEHPGAWVPVGNVKWPFEYLVSGLKALGVGPDTLYAASTREFQRRLFVPMRLMGQRYQNPLGPDGLAEADEAWITPQGIAGRIQWAMGAPEKMLDELPDPRDFLTTALGSEPPSAVQFAAFNAESQREGVGIILASPAFQRR